LEVKKRQKTTSTFKKNKRPRGAGLGSRTIARALRARFLQQTGADSSITRWAAGLTSQNCTLGADRGPIAAAFGPAAGPINHAPRGAVRFKPPPGGGAGPV